MVQYETRGGIDSFALYKPETIYGTDPGTWTSGALHFGIETSIRISPKRNLRKVRGMSGTLPSTNDEGTSRDALQIFAGKYEIGLTIEFEAQTFAFLEMVFGSVDGTDPYNYPRAATSTEADKKEYIQSRSFSVMARYDYGASDENQDKVWIHSGVTVNSMTMRAALDEAVSISLDCLGSNTTGSVTTVSTSYPYTALSALDVYNFSQATVSYAGTPIPNIIDGFEFTVGNTAEILYGLGSFLGRAVIWKGRDIGLTIDLTNESTTFMDDFLGAATSTTAPTTISSIIIVLTRDGSSDLTLTLKNLKMADTDVGLEYGEVNREKLTLEAEYAYVVENVS